MSSADDSDIVKIKKDLIEIEDLISQMLFFAHHSSDRQYAGVMVTNMSRKILEFLQIEFKDIEHVFRHEHPHHNTAVHTANEQSSHLHIVLKKQGAKIKKSVSNIPVLCKEYVSGKVDETAFRQKLERQCSEILKLVGSEEHELGFAKGFVGSFGKK
jgi:hypothetical protein